eukprot:10748881-Ditylum_brightwellii.AAC.1
MKGHNVATVDIPGAFMQAGMDGIVHMKIEGTMAELLTKLYPKLYQQYLRSENVKKVKILMIDYIDKLLKDLPEDFNGEAATPAENHLFEVDKNSDKLNDHDAEFFHHLVAKLIFLYKRARLDVQTSVAFLSTR